MIKFCVCDSCDTIEIIWVQILCMWFLWHHRLFLWCHKNHIHKIWSQIISMMSQESHKILEVTSKDPLCKESRCRLQAIHWEAVFLMNHWNESWPLASWQHIISHFHELIVDSKKATNQSLIYDVIKLISFTNNTKPPINQKFA